MQTLTEGEWVLRRAQEVHGRTTWARMNPTLPSRRAGTLFHWTGRADKHPLPLSSLSSPVPWTAGLGFPLPFPGHLARRRERWGRYPEEAACILMAMLALSPLPLSLPPLRRYRPIFRRYTFSRPSPPRRNAVLLHRSYKAYPRLSAIPSPRVRVCLNPLPSLPSPSSTHTPPPPLFSSAPPRRTDGETVILELRPTDPEGGEGRACLKSGVLFLSPDPTSSHRPRESPWHHPA